MLRVLFNFYVVVRKSRNATRCEIYGTSNKALLIPQMLFLSSYDK